MQVKMLTYRTREYQTNEKKCDIIMSTNKCINYQQKLQATPLYNLRKMAKRFLSVIKKKQVLKKTLAEIQQQNAYNSSLEDMRKNTDHDDNAANEALEQRLYKEIRHCSANSAVIMHMGEQQHILPVHPKQNFIPVHFARTQNGTFFWTSMEVTRQRQEELQLRTQLDRWCQA